MRTMPAGLPKDGTRHSREVALPVIHPVQQGLINFGEQTLTGAFFSSRVGKYYLGIAITEIITLQMPVVNILTTK